MLVLANVFGVESWLIVGLVILLLFGGKKIPELAGQVERVRLINAREAAGPSTSNAPDESA